MTTTFVDLCVYIYNLQFTIYRAWGITIQYANMHQTTKPNWLWIKVLCKYTELTYIPWTQSQCVYNI